MSDSGAPQGPTTPKKELIHRRSWPDKDELRTEVFDYIEVFYNRQRRHRSLGQLSPAQFEDRRVIEDHQITTAANAAA
jgi:transposase InsO family protein